MENLDVSKTPSGNLDEPTSFEGDTTGASVSHSPLDLGGGGTTMRVPKIERPAQPEAVAAKKSDEKVIPVERITGVRTFFTKLHAGAIEFLDEQITKWLKDNPGISVKRTNVITGQVQGKKTEPNIIITVWY